MAKKRILIISPHADDEVLGCGGYLLHSRSSAEISIIIGSIGGIGTRQDYSTRMHEFRAVCDTLGATGYVLYDNKDAMLDTIPSRDIISAIDEHIDRIMPDEILVNYRSRHQDHIKMYECAMASLRLRDGFRPRFVALYEYPFVMNGYDAIEGGCAYHDITDVMDEKVKLFNLYESQVRNSPSPLNEGGITSLAHVRGMECGTEYAEKFYIQKMMI